MNAEEWVDGLTRELGDIVDLNCIRASPLAVDSRTGETIERVMVDVEFLTGVNHTETARKAVGFVALTTPPTPE